MTSPHKKTLIIGPSWVGDMVMAQSLFMTLKRNNSHQEIDVLAPTWSFPLLKRMPEVSNALTMPLTHGEFGLKQRIQQGKKLQGKQYDQVIVLPNSWKSALIPFFAKIPQRTGYLGEMRWGLLNDARKLDKQILTMTVQRFVALGLPKSECQPPNYSIPSLEINPNKQHDVLKKFNVDKGKVLALCPGAEYGPAKQWPAEHYAEVANKVLALGWSVWIFGSDKDKLIASQINRLAESKCQDFSGKTSLGEAIDLMSLVDVAVSNDSGLMHIAAALNKNLIAIYGSSDPNFTPPLNSKANVINLNLDCSPCFKRACPLGHTNCLNHILPQQIFSKILNVG